MTATLYHDPKIYDILHWPGTPKEVRGLLKMAARFVSPKPRTFLEPACGSGRYLRPLAAQGHSVIGFDLEPSMVAYAKQSVAAAARPAPKSKAKSKAKPLIKIFKGDMRTFSRHVKRASVDFAFNPINSIRHLNSDRAMLDHFAQIARVLRPGGVYAVGLSLSAYGIEGITEDVWTGSRAGCTVSQVVTYFPPKGPGRGHDRDERVHSHLSITTRKGAADADSSYILRAYNLAQWNKLVERSALQIIASVDEQGQDHRAAEPGYCIFILAHRKPANSKTRKPAKSQTRQVQSPVRA